MTLEVRPKYAHILCNKTSLTIPHGVKRCLFFQVRSCVVLLAVPGLFAFFSVPMSCSKCTHFMKYVNQLFVDF